MGDTISFLCWHSRCKGTATAALLLRQSYSASHMRLQHQNGYLKLAPRKSGPPVWEFRYREEDTSGRIVRPTRIIGTLDEFPTKELASAEANGLRMRINEKWHRQ